MRRADKDNAGGVTGVREVGIFRKEAVAGWMASISWRTARFDDAFEIEVSTQGFAGSADAVSFVRLEAVQGKAVSWA